MGFLTVNCMVYYVFLFFFISSRAISAIQTAFLGNTATYDITTDSLWEGTSNLYFTNQRAIDAVGSFNSAFAISAIEHAQTLTLDPTSSYSITHTAGDSAKHFIIEEHGPAPLIIQHGATVANIIIRTLEANSNIDIINNGSNSNINITAGGTGHIHMNSDVVLNNNHYFYLNPGADITLNSWRIKISDTTGLAFERCTSSGPPLVWQAASTMYVT